ncbi:proline-rich protein 4-like [Gastrolobium bilobum]|uniref:proline-rich protein 4-like n=1 Tax=Gastrolobium bilobum TaxID=150636 RepID=UPI002AB18500|nr:proline-rich protein 4-like [Gastrolobium bilobum]
MRKSSTLKCALVRFVVPLLLIAIFCYAPSAIATTEVSGNEVNTDGKLVNEQLTKTSLGGHNEEEKFKGFFFPKPIPIVKPFPKPIPKPSPIVKHIPKPFVVKKPIPDVEPELIFKLPPFTKKPLPKWLPPFRKKPLPKKPFPKVKKSKFPKHSPPPPMHKPISIP